MQHQSTKVERLCESCGAPFFAFPSAIKRGKGRWCSRRCRHRNPIEIRFWEKVDKNGPIPEHCPELGPCWLWTGSRNHRGYGYLGLGGSDGGKDGAHRISWRLHFGGILTILDVLHHCDNPPCVRPDHLFAGTAQDNVDDMMAKGRNPTEWGTSRQGERNASARLSEIQVVEIWRLSQAGMTHKAIALHMGCTEPTVWKILNRRSWQHVMPPGEDRPARRGLAASP